MEFKPKYNIHFALIMLGLIVAFFLNISLGSVSIPVSEIIAVLTGKGATKDSWNYIIMDYRLPQTMTAMMAGGGLAISGLLMQTSFRNPLAGPFVLGLRSGASLGVAVLILGAGVMGGFLGTLLLNPWSMVMAAGLGSFLVLLAVLVVTFRIKDTMAILIIGLMFGSVTAAIVSVLSYFSDAEQLR